MTTKRKIVRKSRRRRKNNFWYDRGHLRASSLLLIFLLVFLVFLITLGWLGKFSRNNQNAVTIDNTQKKAFIEQILPAAQQQQQSHHLLTSITLAQAALESDWGQSQLANKYHNLFGIKSNQTNSKLLTTKEYVNGSWITVEARFAVYNNWTASIAAHTQLLLNGTKWDKNHYQTVLQADNYRQAAQALQTQGYATDPAYAQKLIEVIEKYHLNRYDQQ
ncbi:glycoside hydrolase family 73 protein [Liquorilactobacillus sicerae]|uniref:glycoside hydrolase family 73 protein n=1 Tax=Liquorilactobacillus sicerae TaxID=1416943 RepID=UPI0024812292|nr:glycoside hydrolase family 73 protein [Liquorilactobacillus sicerae]